MSVFLRQRNKELCRGQAWFKSC